MGERDCEARAAPARRLGAEPAPQALERRVERVETGRGRSKATMLVPGATALLDACEMEERLRDLVALGPLAPLDLFPGPGPVGDVVPETDVTGPDRVEDPAGLALDRFRDQRNTPRKTRAA